MVRDSSPPDSSLSTQTSHDGTVITRLPNGWDILFPDGARYRVTADVDEGLVVAIGLRHDETSIEHYARLAGPVTTLAARCCGFVPLHAAGLVGPQDWVGVTAPSGTGKSTLAALALSHGMRVIGDDMLAVDATGHIVSLTGALRIDPTDATLTGGPACVLPDGRGCYPLDPPAAGGRLVGLLQLERASSPLLRPMRIQGIARWQAVLGALSLAWLDQSEEREVMCALQVLATDIPVFRLQLPDNLTALRRAWPAIGEALAEAAGCGRAA